MKDHNDKRKKKKKSVKPKTFMERYIPKGMRKPVTYLVVGAVGCGTVSHLLHLPKDDQTIPLTLAPGLKLVSGTASSTST